MSDQDQAVTAATSADGETPEEHTSTTDTAAELQRLREKLSAVNRESAQRRKRLEELEQQAEQRQLAEMTELEQSKAQLSKLQQERDALAAEVRRSRTLEAAQQVAAAQQLRFLPTALSDAYALNLFGDIDPADADAVTAAVKQIAKQRPHWLETAAQPVDISARQRGSARTQASADELIEQKKRSGNYRPL